MTRLASPHPDPNPQGLGSSHIRPLEPTFSCIACHHDFGPNDANLDAQSHLICGACYVANPPNCGRGDHIRAGDCPHERRSVATHFTAADSNIGGSTFSRRPPHVHPRRTSPSHHSRGGALCRVSEGDQARRQPILRTGESLRRPQVPPPQVRVNRQVVKRRRERPRR
jgi:hypothetical protein